MEHCGGARTQSNSLEGAGTWGEGGSEKESRDIESELSSLDGGAARASC